MFEQSPAICKNVSSKTENRKGFFVNRTTQSRFLSYRVSRLHSLFKVPWPKNSRGVSWKYLTLFGGPEFTQSCKCGSRDNRPLYQICRWTSDVLQSEWMMAASESKLSARASKVVRIVSLNKHFWTKLEDVRRRECCLILQEFNFNFIFRLYFAFTVLKLQY